MRTKWDVLLARIAEIEADARSRTRPYEIVSLAAAAEKIRREMASMERTPFGKPCAGCGEVLRTEADFARHFVIPNEQYLNLGDCPRKGKGK